VALADYFHRNAQAAAALVNGFDALQLAAKLEQEVIGIVVDGSVHANLEADAAIDLTVRLLARLYPALVIAKAGSAKTNYVSQLCQLAKEINPLIDLGGDVNKATKVLVFGGTEVPVPKRAKPHTWYVGSDNWVACLSKSAPVGSGNSLNPLGAGAAACIAAANVFRAVFAREVSEAALDTELRVSLMDLRPASAATPNPPFSEVELREVHLVGAGAIGNGTLWALSRMPCRGDLYIVDSEKITDSNLQRYVMATASDRDKEKAGLAAQWLASRDRLSATPHPSKWAAHIASVPEYKVQTVLSAVDTAEARIQIQASLPRVIFNGWTQKAEAGVSRHADFLGPMACLACLYIPTGQAKPEDELVAGALKLPQDQNSIREVRRRLQLSIPTDSVFLQQIAAAADVGYEKLAAFENRPLRDLYTEGVCGGQVMEFHEAAIHVRAEVPMGFQSALAGLLLAAELARPTAFQETISQINLMGTFPERPSHMKAKTLAPPCLCVDEDFRSTFAAKYGVSL
jgi:hypothetical protein